MRQTIQIAVHIDVDYDLARALPEIPGLPGPDGHPPIPALEMIAESFASDLRASVAREIVREGSDLANLGAVTLSSKVRFGKPYEPNAEPF